MNRKSSMSICLDSESSPYSFTSPTTNLHLSMENILFSKLVYLLIKIKKFEISLIFNISESLNQGSTYINCKKRDL
ncbi:hypothetical protein BpHYR1_005447 [Brachionus plicatilis]|uniref:Uncharacterized protein n=1 Tax=Brachionus plicatilis TaxID=10195 RepID=A0A3M7RHL1_BRAPC|nr:hypothetical protein BpHYR1_005447 [Brachionus plicatilis]